MHGHSRDNASPRHHLFIYRPIVKSQNQIKFHSIQLGVVIVTKAESQVPHNPIYFNPQDSPNRSLSFSSKPIKIMAASFSVTMSNNGGNFDELQICLNNIQFSRSSGLLSYKNNFLRNSNKISFSAQKKISNFVVNNFSGSSTAAVVNSAAKSRSDEYLSPSSEFDYGGNKIFTTKKRMVDKEEDFSGKLDQWVKDSVVEVIN